MKRILIVLIPILFSVRVFAQVGVGIISPDASAMLDITSANKGLLIPRIALTGSTDNVTIPSPAASLLIYNTATAGSGRYAVSPGFYYWNPLSLIWVSLVPGDNSPKAAWALGGNIATSPIINYIGTSDNQALLFKINNVNAGYLGINGNTNWGLNSGNFLTNGFSNVAIGSGALMQSINQSNLVAIGDSALLNNGTDAMTSAQGIKNTALGSKALYKNNTGSYNTALGHNTLLENTSGTQNTAIGVDVLHYNTTGLSNTGAGTSSLFLNSTGSFNSAAGSASLVHNSSGNNNTAYGSGTLFNNTTGYSNVAIGINALSLNTDHSNLVAIGDSALFKNVSGFNNTAVGSKSLYSNFGGNELTATGAQSLMHNISGNNNTANGYRSLYTNTIGSSNIAIGNYTLYLNINGNNNSALGLGSLTSNLSGSSNVGIGIAALYSNQTGSNSVAIGDYALFNNIAQTNTAIGTQTLYSTTTGYNNTVVGQTAMYLNVSGDNNTAIGLGALGGNVGGSHNVVIGALGLPGADASSNTSVGSEGMFQTSSGNMNTALGRYSMFANTTGSKNVTIGYGADVIVGNLSNATAIGTNSLVACSNCVVLGSVNGTNSANSNVNVGIGVTNPQTSLHVSPNGPGSILVGANKNTGGYTNLEMGISSLSGGYGYLQATQSSGSSYGNIVLNQSGGNVGIRSAAPLSPLHIKQSTETFPVNGGGLRLERLTNSNHWELGTDLGNDLDFSYNGTWRLWISDVDGTITNSSDLRLKKDIELISPVLPGVMKLQAKSYHYKDAEKGAPLSYGFIAQEVESVFPDFVKTKGVDSTKGITYQYFNIIAIKAIQEQQKEIELLKEQNKLILEELSKLKKHE